MGKLYLKANVRLNGSIEITKEKLEKILETDYESNMKKIQKIAKEDFIRAIEQDLGFRREEINVTKFEYFFDDSEVSE